jgi:hypothetical protein
VAEIVCISCWQGFQSDAGDDEEVICPSCGHAQPALAAREAAEKGEAPAAEAEGEPTQGDPSDAAGDGDDPFDGMEEELLFDTDEGEDPALTQTAEFGQVPDPETDKATGAEEAQDSEKAGEIESETDAEPEADPTDAAVLAPAEEEEEDTRWRFRSGSGLVLFFPTYEVAAKWAAKQSPEELAIARGTREFRPFMEFDAALKVLGDPELAIAAELDEEAAEVPQGSETPTRDELPPSSDAPADPVAEVSPPAKTRSPDTKKKGIRTTTMTSEFKFRTGEDVQPWPGRLLFLALGLFLGSATVYFAAWYGLLPGILY